MYKYIDSNFVSYLSILSSSCWLLGLVDDVTEGECLVMQGQYEIGPCCNYVHPCEDLHTLISDEKVIYFWMQRPNGVQIERVYTGRGQKDFCDVVALAFSYETPCYIYTNDGGLLKLCNDLDIPHSCIKPVVKRLNDEFNILKDDDIDMQKMFDVSSSNPYSGNPFFATT